MSADTRPSSDNETSSIDKRLTTQFGLEHPFPGIEATGPMHIDQTNITARYIHAQDGNSLGYEPGYYLHTNLLPEAFSEQSHILERTLADFISLKLNPRTHITILKPRYQDQKTQGIVFRVWQFQVYR